MADKILYEYAVVRLVPKVEREEFFNVGVILFSKSAKYLKVKFHLNRKNLSIVYPEVDFEFISDNLMAMDKICCGGKAGGAIGMLDTPERFRWLTAVRSTIIQTSRPHPGFSDNLDATLQKLFEDIIL